MFEELNYNPEGKIIGEISADGKEFIITDKLYVYAVEFDGAVYLYEFMGTVGEVCLTSEEFKKAFRGE